MVAGAFAADISARVVEKGSLAGGQTDGNTYIFGMGKTHQKDNDLFEFKGNGDEASAFFRIWADLGDDEAVKVRHANFWFKPMSNLKITIGRSAPGLYGERIDWWKVATGVKYTDFNGWGGPGRYSSAAIGDGYGLCAEFTPIPQLALTAQVIPGVGKATLTIPNEGDASYTKYGVMAKFNILDNLTAGLAWRDNGKDSWKQFRAGVEFGNWGTPYYGFVMPVLLMDCKAKDSGLDGVAIDNYFSYNFDFMNLQARFPVTLRLTGDEGDPSWMCYNIKATFPQDGFGLYVQLQSIDLDDDGTYNSCGAMHTALLFDNFKFHTSLHVGTTFNVGACGFDVAFVANIDTALEKPFAGWYIPFIASVAF